MEVQVIKKKEKFNKGDNVSLPQNKLKVAAYARVSTDMEEQQTSFVSQQKYYLEKITSNPNWIFVEVYADEGISGTQAYKRENFMRMINDAEKGKIDLILTKSISRFARNTLDTLKYVRLLKSNNIGIYFEEEHINTLEMAGELLLTVLSSVAQQESETISSHIKLGFKMKRERRELVGFSNCYGYHYDSKKNIMHIIPEEAKVVKLIFQTYLKGYGTTYIANLLTNMKVISPSGKDHWAPCSINQILRSEKYIGDIIQGKTYTIDSITHKRVNNNGEEDKYYIKEHHEPIIDKETYDKVQELLNNRSGTIKKGRTYNNANVLSGRFRCGFCGRSFSRRSNRNISDKVYWTCMSAIKATKQFCPRSKSLPEWVLYKTFMEAYYLITNNNGLAIDEFVNSIRESLKDETPNNLKANYETEREKLKVKNSKLIDLYVDNQIDKNDYLKKQKQLEDRIDLLNRKIEELNKITEGQDKLNQNIQKIKNAIKSKESINNLDEFDAGLFDSIVDYAIVGGYDEDNKENPFLIRFICRNGFYLRSRNDITEEIIINNGLNNKNNIYTPILDFISTQKFYIFDNINGRRQKRIIEKIRIRVELEK